MEEKLEGKGIVTGKELKKQTIKEGVKKEKQNIENLLKKWTM